MNVPKLRFKEFSGEWHNCKIGDFCKILMCKRIFANETSQDYEIPFYKIGTIGETPDTFISKKLFEIYKIKYNYPKKGELLITCSGTVGKCIIFDGKDSYFQDSNIVWLDNPTLKVSNRFLYYLLSRVDWTKLNSTTITRIYSDNLKQLKINYPEKEEQNKITNLLELLDKKIELQTKKIEALKLFKKGLLDILINNMEIETITTLNKIGTYYSGLVGKSKEAFETGNQKYIPFMSVLENKIIIDNLPNVLITENEHQNKVKSGDLFFTISSETQEEVGMCSTINCVEEDLYLNSFCFGYRLNNLSKIDNEFLCYLLLSRKYRNKISKLGQGFTRVNLSKNQLLNLNVELPKIEVQIRIKNILNTLNVLFDLEVSKLNTLNKQKKGLLQNMFV